MINHQGFYLDHWKEVIRGLHSAAAPATCCAAGRGCDRHPDDQRLPPAAFVAVETPDMRPVFQGIEDNLSDGAAQSLGLRPDSLRDVNTMW